MNELDGKYPYDSLSVTHPSLEMMHSVGGTLKSAEQSKLRFKEKLSLHLTEVSHGEGYIRIQIYEKIFKMRKPRSKNNSKSPPHCKTNISLPGKQTDQMSI